LLAQEHVNSISEAAFFTPIADRLCTVQLPDEPLEAADITTIRAETRTVFPDFLTIATDFALVRANLRRLGHGDSRETGDDQRPEAGEPGAAQCDGIHASAPSSHRCGNGISTARSGAVLGTSVVRATSVPRSLRRHGRPR